MTTPIFQDFNYYSRESTENDNYYLLPFRFNRLYNSKEIIVNDIGEYLIVKKGTTEKIVKKKIDKHKY